MIESLLNIIEKIGLSKKYHFFQTFFSEFSLGRNLIERMLNRDSSISNRIAFSLNTIGLLAVSSIVFGLIILGSMSILNYWVSSRIVSNLKLIEEAQVATVNISDRLQSFLITHSEVEETQKDLLIEQNRIRANDEKWISKLPEAQRVKAKEITRQFVESSQELFESHKKQSQLFFKFDNVNYDLKSWSYFVALELNQWIESVWDAVGNGVPITANSDYQQTTFARWYKDYKSSNKNLNEALADIDHKYKAAFEWVAKINEAPKASKVSMYQRVRARYFGKVSTLLTELPQITTEISTAELAAFAKFTKARKAINNLIDPLKKSANGQVALANTLTSIFSFVAQALFFLILIFTIIVVFLLTASLPNAIVTPVNQFFEKLGLSLSELRNISKDLSIDANQFSASSLEQAEAVAETLGMVQSIEGLTKKNLVDANENVSSMTAIQRTLEDVSSKMQNLQSSMEGISHSNDKMKDLILVIKNISEKTRIMNDIVFQTRLLSFNASVEAARAGDAGKGFSVVAEEVGKLALIAGGASNEINEVINKGSSDAEMLIKENSLKVESGSEMTNLTFEGLNTIKELSNEINNNAGKILNSSNEQGSSIAQILQAFEQIDLAINHISSGAQSTAVNSEKVKVESEKIDKFISDFTLKNL